MGNDFVLEAEGRPPIESPDWSEVEGVVANLGPGACGFAALSHQTREYVQAAGAKLRMIVEFREATGPETFRHYVLGKPVAETKETSINTSAGIVRLKWNEVLSAKSAVEVFRCFYERQTVPAGYTRRDISASFTQGRQ